VEDGPGRSRTIHLVLENDHNEASRLAPDRNARGRYRAQWNDDLHHALHVLLTGETDGYYEDYARWPVERLGRCLAEGFDYQGQPSAHRGGAPRGEPSVHLPPTAFVSFLQNHDQVGNRALGERITALAPDAAVRAATAMLLLSPQIPLLFMGQEFAAPQPFPFFCDFGPDLARSVTEGRRREFARFGHFADEASREAIPDPNQESTFRSAVLDWSDPDTPPHAAWLSWVRELLALRRRHVVPHLRHPGACGGHFRVSRHGVLRVQWRLAHGVTLTLLANPDGKTAPAQDAGWPDATPFYALPALAPDDGELPPWSVAWFLQRHTGEEEP
jgi:malto-oligosyltrehalose trehalohydrolase